MNRFKSTTALLLSPYSQVLLIWIAVSSFTNCTVRVPIPVGFVAQLTGVQAALGVQERNGAQLAVEEINRKGGVDGRRISLVIRDDMGTPEGARKADRDLIESNVVAIIGHATSGQTIAGISITNPARMVMLSPTASSSLLSGKDDYFFRIVYSLSDRAGALARHIYRNRKISGIAVIYDTDNTAYAGNFMEAFADYFRSLGGEITGKASFSSRSQPDFTSLITKLKRGKTGGLLIIAADIDTALIAQRTRLLKWPIPLFTTAWAQTETLINHGGRAVEGLEIEIATTEKEETQTYLDFKKNYRERFGHFPSFGASLGYEAVQVLALALQKTGGRAGGLADELKRIKDFKGLSETYSINEYGDVIRPFYLGVIQNRKFVYIKTVKPTTK